MKQAMNSAATPASGVDAGDPGADRAPLGAHVSVAGGTWEAASRAREISATGTQIFTKQANRWLERAIDGVEGDRYRNAMHQTHVRWSCAHDSYLINLASPDPVLRERSIESFRAELRRCHALGLDALVSHPGNYMDDRASGLARNAEAITMALEAEPGDTRLLMELTAGQGTVLGSTFDEMAALLEAIPSALRQRVGVCLDTAHVWAAGYDLVSDFDGVMAQFDDVLGLPQLRCLHLNDSKAKLGSHLDRHELIAEGTIGADPFRRIMTDERLALIPKIIETPKGDEAAATDGRMLRLLRNFATGALLLVCTIAQTAAGQTRTPVSPARADAKHWSTSGEVGGVLGSEWLVGSSNPTVRTSAGVFLGLNGRRLLMSGAAFGLAARFGAHALSLSENDVRWSGGTLTELDLLGAAAMPIGSASSPLAVEIAGGVAVVSGAREIAPFRDAARVAPLAEVGIALHRGGGGGGARSQQRAPMLVVRYGIVRLDASAVNAITTSGWVRRLSAGLRITR